jgi:hypothetical protein
MADTAITKETLQAMEQLINTRSVEELREGVSLLTESAETEKDFKDVELWNSALIRKQQAATPTKTKRLGTGETLSTATPASAIEKALSMRGANPPLTAEESRESRAKSAEETGKTSSASSDSRANLEFEKRQKQSNFESAQAKILYNREKAQIERSVANELLKNGEKIKILETKNSRMKEFKDLEAKKEGIREDARTTFQVKQGQIRQAMLAFQTRNPYKTVFSSSFGIAAAFIGAIRQSLFGGENEAVKYMNDKVDAMVRQNQSEYSMFNQELSEEETLFKNILDVTKDQMEDIYQQKQVFLDDIGNALEIINEKYSVNMSAEQLQEARDVLQDSKARIENDEAQSVVDRDIAVIDGEEKLQKRLNKTAAQESRDMQLDDPTINPPSKAFIEQYDAAITNIAAVNKAFETFVDIVLAETPKEERDKIWNLWTIQGFGAIHPIFSQMRQILGGEKNARAAYVRAKKEMLRGEQEGRAFAIAKAEQGGGRITEKDFEKTFRRIAKAFVSPQAFAEQVARTIDTNVEILGGLMGAANQRGVYSGDNEVSLNAHQRWLLTHSGSPTLLSPFIYDKIRKRFNNTIVNKSNRSRNAPLTDLQLDELTTLYPPVQPSNVGQQYLRFMYPAEDFDKLTGKGGELFMGKVGGWEGLKSAVGTALDVVNPF